MKSIAEIFDNSNQMIDSIHNFFYRYIGNDLLRKCRISKIVDKIINKESNMIRRIRFSGFSVVPLWNPR